MYVHWGPGLLELDRLPVCSPEPGLPLPTSFDRGLLEASLPVVGPATAVLCPLHELDFGCLSTDVCLKRGAAQCV